MKIERNDVKPDFQPFKLEITIQSQDEAKALFAVFDYPAVGGHLSTYGMCAGRIRESLKPLVGDYASVYQNLREKIRYFSSTR